MLLEVFITTEVSKYQRDSKHCRRKYLVAASDSFENSEGFETSPTEVFETMEGLVFSLFGVSNISASGNTE